MIVATLIKDLQILARDKGALASMFLLPLVFIVTFGLLFQGGDDDQGEGGGSAMPRIQLAVLASGGGEEIIKELEKTGGFALQVAADRNALEQLVSSKKVSAGLVIPAYPAEGAAPATLIVDPAASDAEQAMVAGAVRGLLEKAFYLRKYGAFLQLAEESERAPLLEVRAPAGVRGRRENIQSFQVTVPGNAVLFIFFLSIPLALSFVEERKKGTWKRHLAAPVNRRLMLVAKLLPFFLMGLVQMAFLFATGALVFGMDVSGSVLALAVVSAAVTAAAVALGFLFASFGGSERALSSIGSIALLVMGLLSGCMFPRMFMPEGFKAVGLAFPHGWALDAFQDVLVRAGTSPLDVLPATAAILGFAAVFTAIGALLFRFER